MLFILLLTLASLVLAQKPSLLDKTHHVYTKDVFPESRSASMNLAARSALQRSHIVTDLHRRGLCGSKGCLNEPEPIQASPREPVEHVAARQPAFTSLDPHNPVPVGGRAPQPKPQESRIPRSPSPVRAPSPVSPPTVGGRGTLVASPASKTPAPNLYSAPRLQASDAGSEIFRQPSLTGLEEAPYIRTKNWVDQVRSQRHGNLDRFSGEQPSSRRSSSNYDRKSSAPSPYSRRLSESSSFRRPSSGDISSPRFQTSEATTPRSPPREPFRLVTGSKTNIRPDSPSPWSRRMSDAGPVHRPSLERAPPPKSKSLDRPSKKPFRLRKRGGCFSRPCMGASDDQTRRSRSPVRKTKIIRFLPPKQPTIIKTEKLRLTISKEPVVNLEPERSSSSD